MAKVDSDSSSEEYFDAEDTTRLSIRANQRPSISGNDYSISKPEPEIRIQTTEDDIINKTPTTRSPNLSIRHSSDQHMFVEPKPLGLSGRQRFRDLRNSMQNDEDENLGNTLTPDSQNSSSDGVYTNRPTHPFRIIENDTLSIQSMTSLGRVGKILAGSIDPSGLSIDRESAHSSLLGNSLGVTQTTPSKPVNASSTASNIVSAVPNSEKEISSHKDNNLQLLGQQSKIVKEQNVIKTSPEGSSNSSNSGVCESISNSNNKIVLQEPDVIASTKLAHSKTTDSITSSGPIAPPRRKKKTRKISSSSSEQFNMNEGFKLPPIEKDDRISLHSISISKKCGDLVKELEKTWSQVAENQSKEFQALLQQQPSSSNIGNFAVTTTTSSTTNWPNSTAVVEVNSSIGSGSINRMSHSLGNSSTSVYSKPSPSNSAKSNSAPGRVRYFSIDPTQGLNLYKVSQGVYVVQPMDDAANKAEGPSQEEIERIEKLLNEDTPRQKLAGTGSNSLGSGSRYNSQIVQKGNSANEQRRRSAGDEDVLKQMNIYVRTRTDSGKQLTDKEILDQVPVKNLDTGENMPLSSIRPPPTPDGWNPLSLHIHKLYGHLPVNQKESDEESIIGIPPNVEVQPGEEEELETEDINGRLKKRTQKIKRFFGSTVRKTVDKAKSLASEVSHARHKEDVADIVDVVNPELNIKIKASSSNKGPYEFAKLQHVQDLSGEHTGAVWCMKFSSCARLLATAGQDKILRIWVLKDAYPFFQDMRTKYSTDQKSSPTPSQESLVSQLSIDLEAASAMAATAADKTTGPFMPKAFCSYIGHTSDLLDVSWSKNYFILSSSMDKTVRLWHISRKECLCCFQHIDFVTAIAFHPRDDRYFLSGSLDGKLRLWNIPDKKVALWNEVDGQIKLITAANFCQNGQFAVVGTYDGRCIFYNTDQLKYHTQINVRSTRGKNRIGRKISGIEPMPGEDKILVTSNDSRIRLYDLRDLNLSCKYKGYLNVSSQIKASFSHDGKYIVAGSENQCIYIWKTNHDCAKLSSVRRDRSDFWEGIKAHNAQVTCSIFAPHPEAVIKPEPDDEISNDNLPNIKADPLVEQRKKGCGYVLVSADFNGAIKIFINKTKPKHSSLPYTAIE